ncbi:7127_t:CDS:2, partial [Funneliformis geosporum]
IGAHELMWIEDYESDLISIISSFSELLVVYGEDKLNILMEYYRAIIDNNVSEEWNNYKAIIYANYKTTKLELLLPKLFEKYFETFPNILKLL